MKYLPACSRASRARWSRSIMCAIVGAHMEGVERRAFGMQIPHNLRMPPLTGTVLVVVSFYDARPRRELDLLLDQIATLPAGWPFAVRVVVNQDGTTPLDLGARHRDVEVLH